MLLERFPLWVESVELVPASRRFAALREAAELLGSTLEPASVLELVAYAFGRDGGSTFARLCAAVATHDPSFSADGFDLEPHLLATGVIARALENDNDTAIALAGAVLSAEFAGLHSPVAELPQLARAAQARIFAGLRESTPMPALGVEQIVRDLPTAIRAGSPAEAVAELASASAALGEALEQILAGMARRFEMRLDAADEEVDVLWWAFGAGDGDSHNQLRDIPGPDAIVRAGVELEQRHRFAGELPTASAILRRGLGPLADEEYRLSDVIAATAGAVQLATTTPGPLFPILTSNAACLAFQGEGGWIEDVGRHGIDPTIRRRGEQIAAQTLRELLLVRSVGL